MFCLREPVTAVPEGLWFCDPCSRWGAAAQKGLKILAMHCRDDMAWNFDDTMKSYELLKAATGGEDNFTFVEMPDSAKEMGYHSPKTPASQQHIVEFLGGQMPSAE